MLKIGFIYWAYLTDHDNYRGLYQNSEKYGITFSVADTLEHFENIHGNINSYNGMLFHPKVDQWLVLAEVMKSGHPSTKFAFVSREPEELKKSLEGLVIFHPSQIEEMKEFFETAPAESSNHL
jgi:hypothetical protein